MDIETVHIFASFFSETTIRLINCIETTFMKIDGEAVPFKELNKLAFRFLETNEANDINDVLGLMLEVYLQHAPVEKTDLVNATSLIYRLNKFFFNLEALKGKVDGHPVLKVDEGKQQCSHN